MIPTGAISTFLTYGMWACGGGGEAGPGAAVVPPCKIRQSCSLSLALFIIPPNRPLSARGCESRWASKISHPLSRRQSARLVAFAYYPLGLRVFEYLPSSSAVSRLERLGMSTSLGMIKRTRSRCWMSGSLLEESRWTPRMCIRYVLP